MNKKVILISHGKLAAGMEFSVQMIFGKSDDLASFGLMPDGNYLEVVNEVKQQIMAEPDRQFIVVADIFGGSVCNGCVQEISMLPNVKLVAGMNMGLVVSIMAGPAEMTDADLETAIEESRQGVKLVEPLKVEGVTDGADDFF